MCECVREWCVSIQGVFLQPICWMLGWTSAPAVVRDQQQLTEAASIAWLSHAESHAILERVCVAKVWRCGSCVSVYDRVVGLAWCVRASLGGSLPSWRRRDYCRTATGRGTENYNQMTKEKAAGRRNALNSLGQTFFFFDSIELEGLQQFNKHKHIRYNRVSQ